MLSSSKATIVPKGSRNFSEIFSNAVCKNSASSSRTFQYIKLRTVQKGIAYGLRAFIAFFKFRHLRDSRRIKWVKRNFYL